MENSLHAFVFWLCILQMLRFLAAAQRGEHPPLVALTMLLVVNSWVRADAGIYSAALYLSALIAWAHAGGLQQLLAPPATGSREGF